MAVQRETACALSPEHRLALYKEARPPLAIQECDDSDEFEDAEEGQCKIKMEERFVDLEVAFEDCEIAIKKFFNNDIQGALAIMRQWAHVSVYHSLGEAIFEFIPAMLTFDQAQIKRALEVVKVTISMCNQHRRNYTFVETFIKKPHYGSYTDNEAHAELCYAEALLLQATMTMLDGEDFTCFIKGTLKVKSCFNTYKECAKMFEKKEWGTENSKKNFQSGIRLGLGAFNLMISLFPPKIISLLEFVGFAGSKSLGLSELEAGSMTPGLRSVLCDLTLLAYQLFFCTFTGAEGDFDVCDKILYKELMIYPNGVWFLLFRGRLEFMRGDFDRAIMTYNLAIMSQDIWKQFRHVCYWEIMWVNGLKMDWRMAAEYADKLVEESGWSRTIYSYSKAAMLLQLDERMKLVERTKVNDLLRTASHHKQRIAGKSLPMEKFVINRCARYQAQGHQLVLPGVELLCLFNMFNVLIKNERAAQNMLKLIEVTRQHFERGHMCWEAGYEADNRALLRYLHGCLLLALNLPHMALDTLDTVFQLKSAIKEDTFLLPYALAEMAMCHYKLGDYNRAMQQLQETKKKFTGYSLESRLHFRMHSKLQIIKEKAGRK